MSERGAKRTDLLNHRGGVTLSEWERGSREESLNEMKNVSLFLFVFNFDKVMQRIRNFLPQISEANRQLEDEEDLVDLNVENVTTDSQYIEMDVLNMNTTQEQESDSGDEINENNIVIPGINKTTNSSTKKIEEIKE